MKLHYVVSILSCAFAVGAISFIYRHEVGDALSFLAVSALLLIISMLMTSEDRLEDEIAELKRELNNQEFKFNLAVHDYKRKIEKLENKIINNGNNGNN